VKRDMRVYIGDILESISKIEEYTKAISKDDFSKNTQVQDAVLRRLEVIGSKREVGCAGLNHNPCEEVGSRAKD